MIYHLRRNPHFKYEEVFLKEFLEGEDQELFKLAFIYGKMRERLELDSMDQWWGIILSRDVYMSDIS